MMVLLHISPILLVVLLIIVGKFLPLYAAIAGVLSVLLLWFLGVADTVSVQTALAASVDTGVLFLATASVIVSGLAFVLVSETIGSPQALRDWVQDLQWGRPAQVLFIVLGLMPLLESMTGFGVSLIVTVPLLVSLFDKEKALRIALAGMAIMPWGTLGLATQIGATLANLPSSQLGMASSVISSPVFFVLTAVALYIADVRTVRAWAGLVVLWLLFIGVLVTANIYWGVEIAGVCAGTSVLLCAAVFTLIQRPHPQVMPSGKVFPYIILPIMVLLVKALKQLTENGGWVLYGHAVQWQMVTSPAIPLFLTLVIMLFVVRCQNSWQSLLHSLVLRAWRPLLTIFFFLLLSQLMMKAGFLMSVQAFLRQLPITFLPVLVATFAVFGGYITGSAVGANALLMPVIGTLATSSYWLAAVQNSAAAHGALGSLSILSLMVGLSAANRHEEARLVRYAFTLVLLNMVLTGMMGTLLAR
ncbi:hypothetical protein [Lonepinella sp. MS14434]|uniref:hypothetical protein n=1 Tax=Lonepinella sp. MS14434 TaxID=3003617 RepID=UPI0036DE4D88